MESRAPKSMLEMNGCKNLAKVWYTNGRGHLILKANNYTVLTLVLMIKYAYFCFILNKCVEISCPAIINFKENVNNIWQHIKIKVYRLS